MARDTAPAMSGYHDDYEGASSDDLVEGRDAPQDCDLDDDDATPTVPCSQCGEQVPDLADRCPYCGDWIVQSSSGGAPSRRLPAIIVAVAMILALLYYLL